MASWEKTRDSLLKKYGAENAGQTEIEDKAPQSAWEKKRDELLQKYTAQPKEQETLIKPVRNEESVRNAYKKRQETAAAPIESAKTEDTGKKSVLEQAMEYHQSKKDEVPILDLGPQVKKTDDRTWFQKGALEDGATFKNWAKGSVATTADAKADIRAGALRPVETAIDTATSFAPANLAAQIQGNYGDPAQQAGANIGKMLASLIMGKDANYVQEQQNKAAEEAYSKAKTGVEEIIKNDLINEQAIANKITDYTTAEGLIANALGIDVEKNSFLGEKSDALAQSAGQLGITAALHAAGVPGWLVSGVSAYGGEVENALQQGATLEEATASAFITAGAEILTEKLSGGIKFGGKALDDVLTQDISKKISSRFIQALAKFGIQATGEGFEEIFSDGISKFGQWLTYQDDKTLQDMFATKEAFDEALEAFIGGSILGGFGSVSQSVQGAQSDSQGGGNTQGTQTSDSSVSLEATEQEAAETKPGSPEWVQEIVEQGRTANAPTQSQTGEQAMQAVIDEVLSNGTVEKIASSKQNQFNIDNTNPRAYNENTNGGEQNERTGGFGTDQERVSGVYEASGAGYQGRSESEGTAVNSGLVLLSPSTRSVLKQRGVVDVELHESSADNTSFSLALDAARNADEANGWAVTPKTGEELDEHHVRTFMDKNGTTGFGIATDGDIVAVFANKSAGAPKGATKVTMPTAIANGGKMLDCYGKGLVKLYTQYGFVPVARVKFNSEYANEGWNPSKGEPDIYFMMHNGDSADTVVEKYGTYTIPTDAELNALPEMEYDEAYEYREQLMNQQKTGERIAENDKLPSVQADESVGAAPDEYGANTVGGAESKFEHKQKTSAIYENTYKNATNESVKETGKAILANDPNAGKYDVVTEQESLHNADLRTRSSEEIDAEYDYLISKDGWTGEDNDTAFKVLEYLTKSKDAARLRTLARKQATEGTKGGQLIQSFAKYTRMQPAQIAAEVANVVDKFTENDVPRRFYKEQGFEEWKNEIVRSSMEIADQIAQVPDGDVEGLKEIIRSMAKFRKTTAWFGMSSNLTKAAEAAMKKLDFNTAKGIANAQLRTLPNDFKKRSAGQVVNTIRIQNMLASLTTIRRNLSGNTSVGFLDAISDSTVGQAFDAFLSQATGKRVVGADVLQAKAYAQGAIEATQIAALCTELDIPLDSESRFSTGRTRTFSPQGTVVTRFMSAFEKYMRYALEVTDQFYEGGSSAATNASLQKFVDNSKLTEEQAEEVSKLVGKRRTYKDDRALRRASTGVKNALNEIGGEHLGLGDMTMPFAATSASVAQVGADYLSLGLGGIVDCFRLFSDVKHGKYKDGYKIIKRPGQSDRKVTLAEAQREAATNAGRGVTGLFMVSTFAALAICGALKVHDDEDKDKRGLEQSLNLSGAQFNVDAAIRGLTGGSTDWQEGDTLLSADYLEPFNAQMRLGYLLSEEDTVQDMAMSYGKNAVISIAQSILDMPVMQGLSDQISAVEGAISAIEEGENPQQAIGNAAGQVLGSMASGFIPAPVRQAAQVIDPYYRDTSGETAGEKAVNQILAQIPFASQTLPKKYSGLGMEQTRNDNIAAGIYNTFFNPGDADQLKANEVESYLKELADRTGVATFYPEATAPGSFTLDKQKVVIDGKQDTEAYQKTYGDNVNRLYSGIIQNEDFLKASDEKQIEILNSAKSYAAQLAKAKVSDYDQVPSYIKNRAAGMSEMEAIIRHELLVKDDGEAGYKTTEKYSYLSVGDAAWLVDMLSEIKPAGEAKSVSNIQKIEAVTKADNKLTEQEQQKVIEDILDDSGYAKYLEVLKLSDKNGGKLDNDDFAASYRIYLDEDKAGGKGTKDRTIKAMQKALGVSQTVAKKLYEIYH